MALRYFLPERIVAASRHLENYDSNWVLVPLVFAVNGVTRDEEVNALERAGTDVFLNRHFHGSLIGLRSFENGTSALRPRFREIYGNMRRTGKGDDYAIHQGTKLWANGYSSRGYREMRIRNLVTGERSHFRLTPAFKSALEESLPADFRFEELLVWLYAFSGFDGAINNWSQLSRAFQEHYLGRGKRFADDYSGRFRAGTDVLWPEETSVTRPPDDQLQRILIPSLFTTAPNADIPVFNRIVYGPPGVGKSFTVKQEIGTARQHITTFHPEYSYSDFVGSFRPATERSESGTQKITYRFHPEAFLLSYVDAWNNAQEPVFLVVEEINRGNSAAIFGDIFQLLDRDRDGYSEYVVSPRREIQEYLRETLSGTEYSEAISSAYSIKYGVEPDDPYSILLLPRNLLFRATMNTSDQSLFPMDSAFKRRWSWQYQPIDYGAPDKEVVFGDRKYSWLAFLGRVNAFIYEVLETEDKCIGPFFVRGDRVTAEEFRGKVIFYLWNDILRDELPETRLRIFPRRISGAGELDVPVNFNDFFDGGHGMEYAEKVLANLGLQPAGA